MKNNLVLGNISIALLLAFSGIAPTIASSATNQSIFQMRSQITTDPHYDRNPSFLQANDGTYWLFFTRGRDNRGVRGLDGYDPDQDSYNIYYKTARIITTLPMVAENLLPGSNLVTTNAQRDIATLQTSDGTIWVFTSSGYAPSTDPRIFYYTYHHAKWSGPIPVEGTNDAGHIDALEYRGKIWIFFDAWAYTLKVISYDEKKMAWSTPQVIHEEATLPKGIIDRGKFYVVWASMSGSPGAGIYLSTSNDGTSWTSTSNPIAQWGAGLTNWDPILIKDGNAFRLFWAPSNSEQFIATSTSSNPTAPTSWSTPVRVTTASHGTESWWDFWPEPYRRGSRGLLYMFYTSERNKDGTAKIDGNIWMSLVIFIGPLTQD